jgi:hypothetical protein
MRDWWQSQASFEVIWCLFFKLYHSAFMRCRLEHTALLNICLGILMKLNWNDYWFNVTKNFLFIKLY